MRLAWRLALRDLRGGIRGLRLLAVCLFLGVATLAGIGSLSSAMRAELSAEGRTYLGGDIQLTLSQRRASDAEQAVLAQIGRVSQSARMNAMLARPDGTRTALASLKAVDARYPLVGRLALQPGALPSRADGILLDPALAQRLAVHPGDALQLGEGRFVVTGLIADEPDRLGEGFRFAPSAIIPLGALERTGLVQPGSLYDWRYRIAVPAGADAAAIADRLKTRLRSGDAQVRDSSDGAPGVRRSIDQIGQFLTLVGLTALVIAGIGVGNGVGAWLEGKRSAIATLKSLGAASPLILRLYLIQIALVAGGAIAAALLVGAAVPGLVSLIAGSALPVPVHAGIYPGALMLGALYGLLVALAFALPPLDRARGVTAATLFRGAAERPSRPQPRVIIGSAIALGSAVALAIATARQPGFAAGVLAAAAGTVVILGLIARAIRALAAGLPRPRRPLLRLAIANLHAPGAQTGRLVLALGLGLTLFVTLATIQTNLSGALRKTVPERAPSFFVLDIPSDGLGRFQTIVRRAVPGATIKTVPSLRGPVVAIGNQRVADMKTIPEGAWILRGDRGLTFASDLPEGNSITAGHWWPKDYAGPPLVSMDAEAGRVLGLKVGDSITVSALGVEIPATIASFRQIEWRTMGFNFVLIFSPHSFDGAPFNYMATIEAPIEREDALNRAVALAFPSSSLIRVKDIVATVSTLFGQLATAVGAAASVAIASGIAVLVGAILAARQARTYDAVLLKLLGATRRQVLAVQALEYALLATVIAAVALAIGVTAGWYVTVRMFELPWAPTWPAIFGTLGSGIVLILVIGLAGTLPVLAARPAQALRAL
ncbi:ABC transporter permease [Flavisphingomonas formosensis]|uniref:ABC transporter permease n=1 Tax=Flavisphingomonas formosensis TaxID=861534 RepID=UPI0012F9DF0F|nr:FtsX-like permease family protein [Sphingomonas formosensis]